ncbi:ABC transporter permease [Geitlerinema sp. CS-897]|uniref:ABC transporter permease n=1 Tax=Baaleninema simplex TaxID=2862350 RepID=UPI0003494A65|nr:ABC transporter permease [Baaleninema simplex]MDC0831794.1 ABC transporter permease [Geitlerinema sp. CS-897]
MNIVESLKMAGQTLVANKLRSSLTMLGIIIGNASVIATIGVGQGAQRFVTEQVSSLGTNLLFILPGSPEAQSRPVYSPQTLVWEDAKAIAEQIPSVSKVAPQLNSSELVSYRNRNVSALIYGTTPELLSVRDFDVAQGRFINDLDVKRNQQIVAIGSEMAERLFGETNPIGEPIRIKNATFTVVGVMQPKGSTFGTNLDETVFVPVTTMANRIVGQTSPYGLTVTFINVSIEDESQMNAAKFQIENLLRLRHKITDEDDFTVRSQKDLQETTSAITGALTTLLAAVASISLLVGGIGIMNIMLVSVTERTQEIGLRKAVGASQTDILMQFTIEAVLLSVMGGFVGTGIGVSGILLISQFTTFQAGLSLTAIVLATGVSGGIGLVFGVLPARRAAKLDPIVALRTV